MLRVPRAHRTKHSSSARHERLEARGKSSLLQATWPLFLPHTGRYAVHSRFMPVVLLLLLLRMLLITIRQRRRTNRNSAVGIALIIHSPIHLGNCCLLHERLLPRRLLRLQRQSGAGCT